MREITKAWLKFAQKDLEAAKVLFKGKSYSNSIWHCHQTIEKTLKAIIIEKKIKLRKTHDLIGLVEDAKISLPKSITYFIEELNPYYNPIRYPDAFLGSNLFYSRAICQKFFKTTKEVHQWLKTLIP